MLIAIAAGSLLVAAAWAVWQQQQAPAEAEAENEWGGLDLPPVLTEITSQASGLWETYMQPVALNLADRNLQAFLAVIRYAEGTAHADGYRTLFGGGTFDGYADHPRISVTRPSGARTITSTAAGAYQFLSKTWDDVRAALNLPDFSPASQDLAAAWLIRRRGALADVFAGRFEAAIKKCALEWASLPGSPYGQPVKTLAQVQKIFLASGGAVADGVVYA